MAIREILLLGNPLLLRKCEEIRQNELTSIRDLVGDMHDTLLSFRAKHGIGRAIAAPQIGVLKRLVYMYINEPVVFINPVLDEFSDDKFELWDDCMSFPNLLVRVKRHSRCRLTSRNMAWEQHQQILGQSLSELLQHEVDHLDGILAVSRAIDGASFTFRSELHKISH